CQKYATPPYSF
nr:immunoglobulin light chain junction region [Macaca mulatta]MOW35422.1 immunoglobulin light chain junction region [Macaca mulatta]